MSWFPPEWNKVIGNHKSWNTSWGCSPHCAWDLRFRKHLKFGTGCSQVLCGSHVHTVVIFLVRACALAKLWFLSLFTLLELAKPGPPETPQCHLWVMPSLECLLLGSQASLLNVCLDIKWEMWKIVFSWTSLSSWKVKFYIDTCFFLGVMD